MRRYLVVQTDSRDSGPYTGSMAKLNRYLALAVLLSAVTASAACGGKTIQNVLADPGHYRDRDVTISGNVIDSYSVAGQGAYHLEDRTGRIWVVSTHGVPRKGAEVKTTGTIKEGFDLGALGNLIKLPSGGVILTECEHKVR